MGFSKLLLCLLASAVAAQELFVQPGSDSVSTREPAETRPHDDWYLVPEFDLFNELDLDIEVLARHVRRQIDRSNTSDPELWDSLFLVFIFVTVIVGQSYLILKIMNYHG